MSGASSKLKRLIYQTFLNIGILCCCLSSTAEESAWSSLSGRFVMDGPVPKAQPFDLGRDSCCIKANPADQRWLVGPNQGIANVVISLRTSSRTEIPLPDDEIISTKPVVLTNTGCSFSPRILLLRSGQTLRITNDDPTTHNVAATLGRNASFNVVLPPKDYRDMTMASPERKPMPVGCNIHPYMRGYVSVRNDPYIAVSDAQGNFRIDPLPAGDWEFQLWHEGRYLTEASLKVDEEAVKADPRGRIRLAIKPNKPYHLGDILVKPLLSESK